MGWLKGKTTRDAQGNTYTARGEYVERDRQEHPECRCRGTFLENYKGRQIECRHCG